MLRESGKDHRNVRGTIYGLPGVATSVHLSAGAFVYALGGIVASVGGFFLRDY